MELDLDAKRAERAAAREAAGWTAPMVRFGGVEFVLPDEMPMDSAYKIIDGDTKAALEVLLDGQFDEFWKLGPTRQDVSAVVGLIVGAYNQTEPEDAPPPNSNRAARRTSKRPPAKRED